MSTTTKDRITAAAAALATFDTRIAQLADRERDATRVFASNPGDEDARHQVRAARTELDDWRAGREVAVATLEAARADLAAENSRVHAARARAAAERASRTAFRTAVAPHIDRLVRARDEAEAAIASIVHEVEKQHGHADEAEREAGLAGIVMTDIPRLDVTDAAAIALVEMSKGQQHSALSGMWFGRVAEERALAGEVLRRTGHGQVLEPHQLPYAEQIERALNGRDVYAEVRPTAQAAE